MQVNSVQEGSNEATDPGNKILNEIKRWKETTLDVEYLCREDVLKEEFFWNLIQCQKDQLYDFYAREEERLIRLTYSLSNDVKFHLKEKKSTAAYSYLPILHDLMEELYVFREFIIARGSDFTKIFDAYDTVHGTNVQHSELYDLRSTHTFLNGERIVFLEEKVKRRISSLSRASGRNTHNSRRRSKAGDKRLDDDVTLAARTITRTSITSSGVRESLRSSLCSIPEEIEKHCDGDSGRTTKRSGKKLFSLNFFRKR